MTGNAIVEMYVRGGFFMHPILFCSALGLAIILERMVSLRQRSEDRKVLRAALQAIESSDIERAREILSKGNGPLTSVLLSGVSRSRLGRDEAEKAMETSILTESSIMEKGLVWLATVSQVAPLLGFLGTVSGMIHAFEAIAEAERVSARLVASGVSEALITTAAGLVVAIPIQAVHNYFVSRVDGFHAKARELSRCVSEAMLGVRGSGD